MRTRALISLAAVLFAAVSCASVPSAAPGAGQAPLANIRICYSSDGSTQLPVWYAADKGLFAKYGLDPELFAAEGGTQSATVLMSGDADICQGSPSASIAAAVAGGDTVIIAGLVNTSPYSFVVRREVGDPSDLKGGAVAINSPTGSSAVAMRGLLEHLGLEPDADVALVSIGGQGERLAAMESGSVLGTLVSMAQTIEAEEMGFQVLLETAQLGVPHQHTAITTSRRFLKTRRADAVNAMKAVTEAVARIEQDEDGAKAVMAAYMALDPVVDAPSLDEAYDQLVKIYLTKVPYPTLPGLQTELDALITDNPDAADFRPEDLVDLTIVEELEKSGFIASLRP